MTCARSKPKGKGACLSTWKEVERCRLVSSQAAVTATSCIMKSTSTPALQGRCAARNSRLCCYHSGHARSTSHGHVAHRQLASLLQHDLRISRQAGWTGMRQFHVSMHAVAPVAMPPASDNSSEQTQLPQLASLEMHPFINGQGMVLPPIDMMPNGQKPAGFVFAIFDGKQKLQYVGFSKDLRNSLRTLLGRRPEKAHYYKSFGVPVLDQSHMVAVRDAWFEQVGGAPAGNKLMLERNMWQQPVDGGAISARGKLAAAEDRARQTLETLATRGLKEAFIPNPALLENGQVDFLPAEDISEEERAALVATQQAAAAATRMAHTIIDGEERAFHLRVANTMRTNGGHLLDVKVTIDNRETLHRVIVGKQYVEGVGLSSPEPAVEAAVSVLLSTKQVRHTEGVMPVGQFPVNYFTVSEVEQWYPDEFKPAFKVASGHELERALGGVGVAWRFTRLHSYGAGFMEEQARRAEARGDKFTLGTRTSSFVFE